MRGASLCLLIASLTLAGCAPSLPPLPPSMPQPIPPLNPELATPCEKIPNPVAASYDAWQEWMQNIVLKYYGECAARHAATVKSWPQ